MPDTSSGSHGDGRRKLGLALAVIVHRDQPAPVVPASMRQPVGSAALRGTER